MIDEKPRDERRTGHPHVAQNPVDGEWHSRVLAPLNDKCETYWVVDGREETDGQEANGDLEGRFREGGEDRAQADPDIEDEHHGLAAPLICKPARRHRTHAEGHEAGRGIWDELRIAHSPLVRQGERRHRSKDQHEQVVVEVADI